MITTLLVVVGALAIAIAGREVLDTNKDWTNKGWRIAPKVERTD